MTLPPLITLAEAAPLVGRTRSCLQQWVDSGRLPCTRTGKAGVSILVTAGDVRRAAKSAERDARRNRTGKDRHRRATRGRLLRPQVQAIARASGVSANRVAYVARGLGGITTPGPAAKFGHSWLSPEARAQLAEALGVAADLFDTIVPACEPEKETP